MARGQARREVPPLPARASRRGSDDGGDRRAAIADLGRGGEPAARAEIDAALVLRADRLIRRRRSPHPSCRRDAASRTRRTLDGAWTPHSGVTMHRYATDLPTSTARSASPFPRATRAGGWCGSGRCSTTILDRARLSAGDRGAARRGADADRADRLDAEGSGGPADAAGADRERRRRRCWSAIIAAASCAAMSSTTPTGWPRRPPSRRCSRCSARAISRSPSTWRRPASAIRASSRSTARRWREAAESYFVQSEQIPTLVRFGVTRDADGTHVAGGLFLQHLPEGEDGRERLHTRLDHPEWEHVATSAQTMGADELADPDAAAGDADLAAVQRGGRGARARRARRSSRGCRCDADYIASVLAKFRPRTAREMADDDGMIQVDCAFCARVVPGRRRIAAALSIAAAYATMSCEAARS